MVRMAIIKGSSKLIFSGQAEISEPFNYTRLSRVREPVSRSKSGVQGRLPMWSTGARGTRNRKTN